MARYTAIIISVIFLLNPGLIVGQASPSVLMFDFSQNNNTYTWDNSYRKNFDFGRLKCDLNVNTNSMLLKRPYKRWQEQLWATFSAEYSILDGIALSPFMSHTRNALQDRIVYTSELKLSIPVRKFKLFDITPFVANRAIKRLGEDPSGVDKGIGYGVGGSTAPIKLLGNEITSVASYEYYDLNRIPFDKFNAGLSGAMKFNQTDTLTWRLHDSESTTRYFDRSQSPADNVDSIEIIRQVKIDRKAEYFARVSLPMAVVVRATGDMNFLSYYYSSGSGLGNYTEGRNYDIEFEKLFYNRLKLSGGYRYGWGKEDYRKNFLDQSMELGEFSFSASSEITPGDSVLFDGIMGVTSYYDLHSSSRNERDLKTQIYNIRYKHVFSPYFSGELRSGYSNFHQIYISSINSANNNQNKTYLLQTNFVWTAEPGLSVDQIFAIQANYIIFDFVPNQSTTPNRIFRRGSSETRFKIRVTDKFALMPGYLYRYEDYGKLIYEEDNWQMATGWDRRYHNINIKMGYYPFTNFYIEPEYSWELKKEYSHIADISQIGEVDEIIREQRLRDFKQIAAIEVIWSFGPSESLSVTYSRREWDMEERDKDITEFINVSVRYTF